jgi:hypothetical protein
MHQEAHIREAKRHLRTVPHSRMVYPKAPHDRMKYVFWRLYTPFHPVVRDTLTALRIARHHGRQPFLIGHIRAGHTLKEVIAHLHARGYAKYQVAWKDDGEVASLRRVDHFTHQYHVRIFNDGEIRAHYEYTPEYAPLKHFYQIGQVDRRKTFLEDLGECISREW